MKSPSTENKATLGSCFIKMPAPVGSLVGLQSLFLGVSWNHCGHVPCCWFLGCILYLKDTEGIYSASCWMHVSVHEALGEFRGDVLWNVNIWKLLGTDNSDKRRKWFPGDGPWHVYLLLDRAELRCVIVTISALLLRVFIFLHKHLVSRTVNLVPPRYGPFFLSLSFPLAVSFSQK